MGNVPPEILKLKTILDGMHLDDSDIDGSVVCVATPKGELEIRVLGDHLLLVVTPGSTDVDLVSEGSSWAIRDEAFVTICDGREEAEPHIRQAIEAIDARGDEAEWSDETPDWVLSIAKMSKAVIPPEVIVIRTPEARGDSARGLRFEADIMAKRAAFLHDNAMKLLREAVTIAAQAEANTERARFIESTEEVVRQARNHGLDLANVGHIERLTDDLQLTSDKLGAANEVLARAKEKMHETLRKITMPELRSMVAEECGVTPTARDSREQLIDRLIGARFGEGILAKAA